MNMSPKPVHLIVEKGPDQGLAITIPAEGARVGRSSNNDIVLHDPAMSRFHCRFFFKPGEGLWAEDLGSANQTLMNDKPLFESRARVGDRLTMGDTTLKVVSEEIAAAEKPAEKAPEPLAAEKPAAGAPTPIDNLFETPASQKSGGNIQFLRPPAGKAARRRRIINLLAVLLIAIVAATAALLWMLRAPAPKPAAKEPKSEALEIAYEKVQANSNNIFRYHLTLKDNQLSIQVDDLKNKRHVLGTQMKKIDPEIVSNLTDTLRHANFFELKEEYKGLATDVWDIWDLSITLGKKTRRVKVMNTLEPEAFKNTQKAIEEFGETELGLTPLALSPEKLIELARQAALLGRSLYAQRNVKNENLAAAIRSLKEAEWYLETIEPKPDFYADAVALRGESERELQDIYDNHLFLAERAIKLRDWSEAAVQYRLICEKIPARSDERHAAARKKLIDVERRTKKNP